MPIEVPSFWDYLGQGIDRGQQAFSVEKERRKKLADEERERKLQEFGLAAQFGSAEDARRAAIPAGLPFSPRETPPQLAARIRSSFGTPEADRFSPEDYEFAGLTTPKKRAVEDKELDLRGVTTTGAIEDLPREREAKRLDTLNKLLAPVAERHISGVLNRGGGRIKPEQLKNLGQFGYDQWLKERGKEDKFTPEEEQHARSFFEQAATEAWVRQVEMDTKRIAATPTGGADKPSAMLGALTRLSQAADLKAQRWAKANETALNLAHISQLGGKITPQMQTLLDEEQRLNGITDQLTSAATAFGSGALDPSQAAQILQNYTKMVDGTSTIKQVPGQPSDATGTRLSPEGASQLQQLFNDPLFKQFMRSRK